MPNRLAATHSPYLLGHADNPVDWWPWSDAAFAEAQRRGVPVFLSIGYATCHWCHVMEHESFEDPEAARALNEAFVCIKVDREERPDVDGIYMAACLAMNGHGGWPLTALLTPDTREPFYVATYLPKETRGGRIGLLDLVEAVSRFWAESEASVRQSAAEVAAHVRRMAEAPPGPDVLGEAWLAAVADALRRRFDAEHAGFGLHPKFPTPHHALFLLQEAARTGQEDLAAMAVATLRAIRDGGIWDHVGGGLHRYATDRRWLLPHFEKMLYDQALYAMACAGGWAATGDGALREAAEATLAYVLRDLRSPDGAFVSAEDADSLTADGHREEGAFYVWTEAALADALGEVDAAFARTAFGTAPGGNYVDEATRRPTGANVLHRPEPLVALAGRLGLSPDAFRQRERDVLLRLREARAARPRPLLDDKVLTDWNGLMIAAFAVCARRFGRDDFHEAADRAADGLLERMRTPAGGLMHRHRNGETGIDGTLDDYAFFVWGLVELYQTTFEEQRLADALALHAAMRERFEDPAGGYFVSEADAPDLIVRQKTPDDGAIPSGSSVAIWNGLRLAALTGDEGLREAAERGLRGTDVVREHPSGFTFLALAAAFHAGPSQEVVVAGERAADGTGAMVAAVRSVVAPNAVVLLRSPGAGPSPLAALAPFTAAQTALGGAATAYVCERHACQAPTTDPRDAAEALRQSVRRRR